MTKHVLTPMGPLAPPDNPQLSKAGPSSPTKLVGLFHQYPPVDMVDEESHHVPEGGTVGPSGIFVGTEVIPSNELKAINKAGLHATVREAYALQKHREHALENTSVVPTEDALRILEADLPSDYNPASGLEAANTLDVDHQIALAMLRPSMPSSIQDPTPLSHRSHRAYCDSPSSSRGQCNS